jgi:hypothetical protein
MERTSLQIVRGALSLRSAIIAMLLLAARDARAQDMGEVPPRRASGFVPVLTMSSDPTPTLTPYAGKYEARIGASRESVGDKLRLDIGASLDIYSRSYIERTAFGEDVERMRLSFGADFFTWTRLRSAGNFKFPVEAVDYYFGINGRARFANSLISDARLRIAHISAHLVDGDPSFTSPEQKYMTYSREFADLAIGFTAKYGRNSWYASRTSALRLRPYVGALVLFHSIPDTLGAVSPYAGFDATWQPGPRLPVVLKLGYEARLNTELEPIGEHQLRLGLKIGYIDSRGVLIEGSYYSGRSPYGQHFSQRERYFSLGFGIDY